MMVHFRRPITGALVMLAGLPGLAVAAQASEGTHAPRVRPVVRVYPDGSAECATRALGLRPDLEAQPVRFDFGLPRTAPERRGLEREALPICHTSWTLDGIRYSQWVMLTRLEAGDLMPSGGSPADAVLMVQLAGENTNSEYTEAAAVFGVRTNAQLLQLELRGDLAYAATEEGSTLLAAIAVPAEGVETTHGPHLKFRGNMPPGTSGSMTLKIPLGRLEGEKAINRLRDLEFEEEIRRVKRYWMSATNAGADKVLPVGFADPRLE